MNLTITRKKSVLIFYLIAVSHFGSAQNDAEIAVHKVLNEQITAWNNGNIDEFMQTYWRNDSLLFVSSTPIYGWQKALERYKKNYPDTAAMGKLSFNLLALKQLSPEYYFVMGQWHLTRTTDNPGGYFTLLLKKINGKWLIIVDHTS